MSSQHNMSREDAATLQLHLWLTALNRTISSAMKRRGAAIEALGRAASPSGGLAPKHATQLLAGIEREVRDGAPTLPEIELDSRESAAERDLIAQGPVVPPLERLLRDAALTPFERATLLIVVAPEVQPDYRRLYGYLVDDLSRGHASVELVLSLTHGAGRRAGSRRRALGPGGTLRRLGLLRADDPIAIQMNTRLDPAPGLVEWLLGAAVAPPVPLTDPRMIFPPSSPGITVDERLEAAVRCLAMAANAAVGVWGPEPGRHDDTAAAMARALGRPVFQADPGRAEGWDERLRIQAAIAAGADAVLWLETRVLPSIATHGQALAELLRGLPQRILISGRVPWRPLGLIGSRPYAEAWLDDGPSTPIWPLPEDALPRTHAETLDARYRLGYRERNAAVQVALSEQRLHGRGATEELAPALARAARIVSTPSHLPSVVLVDPVRRIDELVLPEGLHRQISEIAGLYGHAETVDGAWGFGRLTGSSGALKALFTGDPGTGKTMAAEAIAHAAGAAGSGVALMKVDLSQVVSKWVGETEKNLEAVFDHAEQSRAVLFFDEADALFGKRGEVRHGTDRYANLEVSYLLQRLEAFSGGLVILASNLRDEIDPAFVRRFQLSLNFPRPRPAERLRIWQLAFARAPLDPAVSLEGLSSLDLTGGGIVTAARMAALLAAGDGDGTRIGPEHLAAATERQFRNEARLMSHDRPDGLTVARARA